VLAANGCTGCHGVDGSEDPSRPRAPTLAGALATAAARLASPGYDGAATTPLDYLRESVVDHCTWVVPGYSCSGVQAYGNWLSPDEVEAVVSAAAALPATP
ncbi:MAG: c-type cytochrome, partial [Anaerolineae bacterium]